MKKSQDYITVWMVKNDSQSGGLNGYVHNFLIQSHLSITFMVCDSIAFMS